jgi:hypothetical protein
MARSFKLGNHRAFIEIGADPEFQEVGLDRKTAKGGEYLLFQKAVESMRLLNEMPISRPVNWLSHLPCRTRT